MSTVTRPMTAAARARAARSTTPCTATGAFEFQRARPVDQRDRRHRPGLETDAYWAFYYDGGYASVGACAQELASGDQVSFVGTCYQTGVDCTTTLIERAERLDRGGRNSGDGDGRRDRGLESRQSTPSLPADAIVSRADRARPSAPRARQASTFSSPGTYTLQASAPDPGWQALNTETVCVHGGNDGTCGTTKPGATRHRPPRRPRPRPRSRLRPRRPACRA